MIEERAHNDRGLTFKRRDDDDLTNPFCLFFDKGKSITEVRKRIAAIKAIPVTSRLAKEKTELSTLEEYVRSVDGGIVSGDLLYKDVSGAKVITCRYDAVCCKCEQGIPRGKQAYWYIKRKKMQCLECR